eukprot:7008015-Prymnesium_polylepis.1
MAGGGPHGGSTRGGQHGGSTRAWPNSRSGRSWAKRRGRTAPRVVTAAEAMEEARASTAARDLKRRSVKREWL